VAAQADQLTYYAAENLCYATGRYTNVTMYQLKHKATLSVGRLISHMNSYAIGLVAAQANQQPNGTADNLLCNSWQGSKTGALRLLLSKVQMADGSAAVWQTVTPATDNRAIPKHQDTSVEA
jgi:hypothetical protein